LALAVGAALQLALDVLADHPVEGLQPQLEVVADARELAGIEAPGLQHPHDLLDVALDRGPVELVRDLPREVADLEEVHQPLEAGVALNVSRSVRPTSALAASASSASEGEMRSSARRKSPMNSRIRSSILFAVGAAAQGSAARRSGDHWPGTRLGAGGLTRLGARTHGARTLSRAPFTRSRSFSYFTSIVSVDSTSAGSSACALRMTSERAQSSDSDTEGGLRSSSARIFCTAATTAEASLAGISGTLSRMISSSSAGAGKSMKRCRQRRLSPSDSSRALFDVSTTSGM